MLKSDLLTPARWNDYELLDSGNFEKLERFGRYVVARPEPQALWNRSLSDAEWRQRADAVFRKDRRSEDRGEWVCKPGMPGQWFVEYGGEAMPGCGCGSGSRRSNMWEFFPNRPKIGIIYTGRCGASGLGRGY